MGISALQEVPSRLAHVHNEKTRVVAGGGPEYVQHTDVHEDPGSRLLHDQGDKKPEEGQVVLVDQLEGVSPEGLLLKVAEKPSIGGVQVGRRRPEAHVARSCPLPTISLLIARPPSHHKPSVTPGGKMTAVCKRRPADDTGSKTPGVDRSC